MKGVLLEIILSNGSDKPIYEQIESQIRRAILEGVLKEGEALPSIRSLANDLRVSVITTKRAYSDLETLGFIETVPGKGSFVAALNIELVREEHLRHVESHLDQAVEEAQEAGLSASTLRYMLDERLLEGLSDDAIARDTTAHEKLPRL